MLCIMFSVLIGWQVFVFRLAYVEPILSKFILFRCLLNQMHLFIFKCISGFLLDLWILIQVFELLVNCSPIFFYYLDWDLVGQDGELWWIDGRWSRAKGVWREWGAELKMMFRCLVQSLVFCLLLRGLEEGKYSDGTESWHFK